MGLDRVRVEQEGVIISTHSAAWSGRTVADAPRWLRLPGFVLSLSGVLPFDVCEMPCNFGPLVCILCVLTLAHSLYTLYDEGVSILSLVCVCYALGGGLGLLSLRWMKIHELIGSSEKLLERYAINHGFFEAWLSASSRLLVYVGLLWIAAVVSIVPLVAFRSASEDEAKGDSTVALTLSFIFGSGVVAVLTYCQLYVCAGLELMVDTFCGDFLQDTDFMRGVAQWNMMQAVMRRAAQTMDSCFLLVQATALTATVLIGMEVMLASEGQEQALRGLPSSLLMAVIMYFGQYRTAAVTEKCLLAPALVNSLASEGPAINFQRQYMVQFITQSAAGFYVKGVRLTTPKVLKTALLCVMAAVGLAMGLFKSASKP